MTSALSFISALRFPCFPLLLLGLAACDPSLSENYIFHGDFSAKHKSKVHEIYRPVNGKLELSLAFLDLDGNNELDFAIQLKGGHVVGLCTMDEKDQSRTLPGFPLHMQRPANIAPSQALEPLVEAASMQPSQQAVHALYDSSEPDLLLSWVLALQLRKAGGTPLAKELTAKAHAALEKGKLVDQSVFILSTLGESGDKALGEALNKVQDERIAKEIIRVLNENKAILPLVQNPAALFEKTEWVEARSAFFRVLESMAVSPSTAGALQANISRLDALALAREHKVADLKHQMKSLKSTLLRMEAAQTFEEEKLKNPEKIAQLEAAMYGMPNNAKQASPAAIGTEKPAERPATSLQKP